MIRLVSVIRHYSKDELVVAMLFVSGGLGAAIAVVNSIS